MLALDTSGYSLFDAGFEPAVDAMEKADGLAIPTMVLGELLSAFRHGRRGRQNRERLESFVRTFTVQWLDVTASVAERYATIHQDLRGRGRSIPTNDLWIAACCLDAGAALLTADAHFAEVDALNVVSLPTRG